MTNAGIRELKARLSEYIGKVKKGETVRVTARGKTVAMLTPPVEPSPERKRLEQLAAEGKIILESGGKPLGSMKPIKLKGGALLSTAIIEDRG